MWGQQPNLVHPLETLQASLLAFTSKLKPLTDVRVVSISLLDTARQSEGRFDHSRDPDEYGTFEHRFLETADDAAAR
jgi:hypothetical protein